MFESKFDVQNSNFGGGYVFRIIFLKLLNTDDIKCKESSTINYRRHKDLRRFSRIIIEKTTFEEFEEICEEIQRKKEI